MSNSKEPVVPSDLQSALEAEPLAPDAWANLTPLARRDFVGWIQGAKQAETRAKRIRIACENLVAGKRRPCCYAVVPMDLYKALGADPVAKAAWSRLGSDEKRDRVAWIEESAERAERKIRIAELCSKLKLG